MAWVYLTIAGLLEVGWAIGLKYTDGFSRFWPTACTLLGSIISFFFLSLAIRTIPVGTGYAVWTGIGAVGTAILGMVLFAEAATAPRLVCIALIVVGIGGLKVTSWVGSAPDQSKSQGKAAPAAIDAATRKLAS